MKGRKIDVCLEVPAIVGAGGVERILDFSLPNLEQAALKRSAGVLKEALAKMNLPAPKAIQ